MTGGNNGSFRALDDEIVLRITSGAENVSPQAIGGFAQRAVPPSQRSLKISVFSRRVGVHEEKTVGNSIEGSRSRGIIGSGKSGPQGICGRAIVQDASMSPCDATLNEVFHLNKGSGGVVCSSFPNPLRQPPEGFTTAVVSPSFPLC